MTLNLRPLPRGYQPLGIAIEPKSAADKDKLVQALERIAAGHPRVQLIIGQDGGSLHAASESDVEAAIESIRAAGIAFNTGAPQIAYREILSAPAEIDYTHKNQSGGTGQFARVKIRFEPSSRTMNNTFVNDAPGTLPDHFLPGVEKGFRAVADAGPLMGFPVVACRATLLDGAYHDIDSSPLAFEIATRAAFREAAPGAAIKLLEPYLEIDITTPQAFATAVIADFKSRRGVNNAKETAPGVVAIYGFAPLANMLGYEAELKSNTQGAAAWSWKLAGLEEVPMDGATPPFASTAPKRG